MEVLAEIYEESENGILLRPETQFEKHCMKKLLDWDNEKKIVICMKFCSNLGLYQCPEDLSKILIKEVKKYYHKKDANSVNQEEVNEECN